MARSEISRRQFIKIGITTGAILSFGGIFPYHRAYAFSQSAGLKKFAQPLRGLGPNGIPVAASDGVAVGAKQAYSATHYSIAVQQFSDTLHPDLGATTLWGYQPSQFLGGGSQSQRHLGGIIVAHKGQPVQLTVTNKLPIKHILPVDTSDFFMHAKNHQNAATVHLHGGYTPWVSDGTPMTWFLPQGQYDPDGSNHGESFAANFMKNTLNPNILEGQSEYYFPNDQSARMLWYHDHAMDLTRLNAYAGVATAYIIRDNFEGALRNLGLPDFIENGGREIPLVIQDKIFVNTDINTTDPTWTGSTTVGSLWYPHVYETSRWEQRGTSPLPDPSCIPEMFGDTMLANGTVYPVATVEPNVYRFRILNACQARFLNLQLYVADAGNPDGITFTTDTSGNYYPSNAKGPDFLVLGTEGGFLPHPVVVPSNMHITTNPVTGIPVGGLVTAPAERWDLLVDFRGFAGKRIILYTDAPAPYPMGDDSNDYFLNNPKNQNSTQQAGLGRDTRQIMAFDVTAPATASAGQPLSITTKTNLSKGLQPFLVPPGVSVQNKKFIPPAGVKVRQLTLNESFDDSGRLLQRLGTNAPDKTTGAYGIGLPYMSDSTEVVNQGDTEIWEIINLTGDTHPVHFHLVNVQLLARQGFNNADPTVYNGVPDFSGHDAYGPDATELGWKETIRVNPGEVAWVIMKFDLPCVPFSLPCSPRTGGNEYVWHCHILEHEEHDMMRPLIVK
jgi:spore coat protein A, manganese oxidase